ncbi:hypothetical protein M5X11_12460 [Paenibacillus alginolyticus]|uniref:hypothetical protein n=1 Tax=Paenibacillus alginolyticus TaxID=59839 RepID=UPI00042A123E|nr:hypothetical protein [Paenibacillus alginolyticus]MCY9665768.1 hypothetical protein [Paenibacillus alginolyticus]
MGKSCAYGSDTLWEYYPTMDNIVMAKMMHDIGKPLPGSCIFSADSFHYQVDSLFFRSIDLLFDMSLDLDENEDEDERRFVIPVPALKELSPEEQKELIDPLKEIYCDFAELEFKTTLGDGELQVAIRGTYGYSNVALKEFIQFKKKLDEKTKGVTADGPHAG